MTLVAVMFQVWQMTHSVVWTGAVGLAQAVPIILSLFPLINAERFGNDPRTLGLFLTAIAVGGMIASIVSGTFTRLPRPGLVMLGRVAAAEQIVGLASGTTALVSGGILCVAAMALIDRSTPALRRCSISPGGEG